MTKYTIEADGHSGMLDRDMVVGVLITNEDTLENWEISEPAGRWGEEEGHGHSQNTAEYLAVYKGLAFLEKKLRGEGFDGVKSIKVITDSQYVYEHMLKKTEIENYHEYLEDIIHHTIRERIIRIKRKFTKHGITVEIEHGKSRGAHALASSAMAKVEAGKHYRKEEREALKAQIDRDAVVLPMSMFKKPEYEKLTIAEALVLELADARRMKFSEIAGLLNRSYTVITNQYYRAKKKTAGKTPPRKLRKEKSSKSTQPAASLSPPSQPQ